MGTNQNIWRSGKLLVMHTDAVLPDRCVKTNKPAHGSRITLKLNWRSPGRFFIFVLVASLIIYLRVILMPQIIWLLPVAALIVVPKKIKVEVGAAEEVVRKRDRAVKGARICYIAGCVAIVSGFTQFSNVLFSGMLIFGGLIVITVGLLWKTDAGNPVVLKQRKGNRIWLSGVCQEYLSSFPEWEADKISD